MSEIAVLLSGGLDSSVLACWLARQGRLARAISADYGQRHRCELAAAAAVAAHLGVAHHVVQLSDLARHLPGSALTDATVPVPDGHYEAASMRATVVPNRNMVLIAVAAGIASAHGLSGLALAVHAGDHAIYPDCRPAFVSALQGALVTALGDGFRLEAPFVQLSKANIVRCGHEVEAPFALTWSCYKGGARHCGQCGTCTERREAFALAGVDDPTEYDHV
jgi:7-cyano-7-deazaguanine synthase